MGKQEVMLPPTRMYPEEVWDEVLEELCNGMKLNEVCAREGMPSCAAVKKRALWDAEWGAMYVRARQVGYLGLADEILDIADTPCPMEIKTYDEGGNLVGVKVADNTQHRMNQINTRKWMLAKMLPKVFGDNATVTHQHAVERVTRSEVVLVRPPKRKDD